MAGNGGIPEQVCLFVNQHIDSVETLEVLLFLFKNPESAWSAQSISERIRTHPASIAQRLLCLEKAGLLVLDNHDDNLRYQFNSRNSKCVGIVGELNRCYSERRVSLVELIFSKPHPRVLGFADAFKFKKEE